MKIFFFRFSSVFEHLAPFFFLFFCFASFSAPPPPPPPPLPPHAANHYTIPIPPLTPLFRKKPSFF